ncbi:hypothetical protein HY950_00695 [Candidatus Gottesmanbacteria bacterium]|nr:hypothetical protein [Candidatus Gottesmanbacteria bacterium]
MELSPVVQALIAAFEEPKPQGREGVHPTVSGTVSLLAVLYEKARNAVEFRAEHLVRRAAIERILKRRIMINGGSNTVAENLILELLWAKYIDSSLVDDAKIADIQAIINRYLSIRHKVFDAGTKPAGITWETLMGLASSEIEETMASARKREALTDFFYQAIRPKITIPGADDRLINIQTYIAIERAYNGADEALIVFHLSKMVQPDWFTQKSDPSPLVPSFLQNLASVQQSLRDPLGEPLSRYIRRHTPPFLLIRDFFLEVGDKARGVMEKPEDFDAKLAELASRRYREIGTKVRRAIVRSIIYIFLTKMLFALALEAPFDLYVAKRVSYVSLAINTLFPPILLFLVAGFISVPGADNTRRLIERIKKIIYRFDELKAENDVFAPGGQNRRPILTTVFSVFYLATFLISFGLISFLLTKLRFNIASQIIFVFFVTLVSFFAYRIRAAAREYEMVERQGFLAPVMDFFFLPILRVGHVLSREIAKINIFIFLFDFILEAPLKVIFEVAEEWIRFVRTKKEEII